ncbi:hypothetical protein BaRGS_00036036 [Batillaria attramentaria]|uniref:Uncharacterized protein n=1 Tax=Batillaria attramentaria TaxID=370345 RepID=A0ABD0JCU3_9CAEN
MCTTHKQIMSSAQLLKHRMEKTQKQHVATVNRRHCYTCKRTVLLLLSPCLTVCTSTLGGAVVQRRYKHVLVTAVEVQDSTVVRTPAARSWAPGVALTSQGNRCAALVLPPAEGTCSIVIGPASVVCCWPVTRAALFD